MREMSFLNLEDVGVEIPALVSLKKTRTKLRIMKPLIFRVSVSWDTIHLILESNHDGNLPHSNPAVAMNLIKRVFPDVIDAIPLRKPILIVPGLWLLAYPEKLAIEIGLKYFGEPLLPTQLNVVWQYPLIVFENEPQLVEFEFKPLSFGQFIVEARYVDKRFKKCFREPIMVCYSKRKQVSPFIFCSGNDRKSGIDENTLNEFRKVIKEKCHKRKIFQGKAEEYAYWKSVGLPVEIANKIFGEENIPPTLIGAKIPSDTPLAVAGEEIYQNRTFVWGNQRLHFDQTRKNKAGKKILMKVLPWRICERTVKILGRKMKMRIQFVDEALSTRKFLGKDKLLCLGRSVIMEPL